MAKGQNFHPQFVEDVLNNTVPKKLKHLVKPWHKTKWKTQKPVYVAEEFYALESEKSYKKQVLKIIAETRLLRLRNELNKANKKHIQIVGNEKRIILQIKKSNRYLPLIKCCELLGISKRKFIQIVKQHEVKKCTPEIYLTCNKKRTNQLTTKEVFTIKKCLEEQDFLAWPISRLHLYAIKNKIVSASYSSWLMVKNLFELNRNKFKPIKTQNKVGIRANLPNVLLHSDYSRFVLRFNKKVYLFIMVDNYSRYILNAVIAEKSNHEINCIHLIDSMKTSVKNKILPIDLMTDKGSENTADKFVKMIKQFGLTHQLAQTDNIPSNSMVERMFARIKKFIRNKYQHIELTIKQLKSGVEEFIQIHNNEMPLFSYNKTPHELYWNKKSDFNYFKKIQFAITERVVSNSMLNCAC